MTYVESGNYTDHEVTDLTAAEREAILKLLLNRVIENYLELLEEPL